MDEESFNRLWRDGYARINYYILHSFPTLRSEAADLTQEAFTKAFVSFRASDPDCSAIPWLYAVARNLCVDRLRKKDATEPLPENVSVDPSAHHTYLADGEDERRRIAEAVEALDPGDREICYLYYFEDMPVKDIGRIVGRPAGTVKYRLFRIRSMLGKRLEDLHEG